MPRVRQARPVSSPAGWAQPPLDYHTHLLLPEGHHHVGVLKTRCGAILPTGVIQHNQLLARAWARGPHSRP